MRNRLSFVLAIVWLSGVAASLLSAQTLKPGPQVLTFHSSVDDTEQPYGLYLPPQFNPKKRYPLVISLHGAGSNHRLNLRRVFGKSNAQGETDVEASRYFPKWNDVDFIVASPFSRGTIGYQGVAEKDVYDVLADVRGRFPIDENRIYLTGLSMGGGGTLWLALTRPDIWAAIVPVCPAPPPETEVLAPNALHLPVRFCQGGADPVVRPAGVRDWAKRLETLGSKVEYIEYPGVAHNSWENAYQDGQIFKWFGQFQRNPHPDRVRFVSSRYKYNTAYWVQLDGLTPGTAASIDASFTADNRIEIKTSALDAFTLRLAGHPRLKKNRPVEVKIDDKPVEVKSADTLSFRRDAGAWVAGSREIGPTSKKTGAEGPMGEVISSRHIYVYGTADSPSSSELQLRQRQASKAAEWCVDRGWFLGRVMVFPRVVADKDVRPSDLESSNLVLFGTRETNKLIAQLADQLPIQMKKDSQGYGLVYVFPKGEHYVLINSGLPWWQEPEPGAGASPVRRGSMFAGPIVAFGLMGFEDYLVFKGAANNPIAAGRFDNNWRLPKAVAEKIRASGVVTVVE
ncbi:MAG: phospholipase [Acidobacteria bacterium]|nr:MAG: phospholipase [Acidobacteriota bacterium]